MFFGIGLMGLGRFRVQGLTQIGSLLKVGFILVLV